MKIGGETGVECGDGDTSMLTDSRWCVTWDASVFVSSVSARNLREVSPPSGSRAYARRMLDRV